MIKIHNERQVLANSLWAATANPAPDQPALIGSAEADCVIIGAGFTGLSAAVHLAQMGKTVVLLEAETPGWGASGRNGGQVNPGLKDSPDILEKRFGDHVGPRMINVSGGSADLVFDLIAQHAIACDARRTGWIRAAHTPKALVGLLDMAAQWRARGVAVDPLTGDETASLLGARAYIGGVIDRRGGNLHPLNYALGLADAAQRQGARIYGHSRVKSIDATSERVVVATANGHVAAQKLLVCTNAYTGDLAQPLGRTVVPVTSVQVATAPLSDNIARSILPDGHAVSDTRRLLIYFRKDADGRFIIGGRGASKDGGVLAQQANLCAAAQALYPQLEGVDWAHAWGGDVALTRDHTPGLHLLGPNILAGLGYNGRGVGMATAMGKVQADWAAGCPGEDLDFPITPARTMPLHGLRGLGVRATVATSRVMDRMGI